MYLGFPALVRLGLSGILRHKLRSLLTTLGVVCGVGSVIAMLSVGEGASREALAQIRRLGSQNILLHSRKPTGEDSSQARQRTRMAVYGLTEMDEARVRESFPYVRRTVGARILRKPASSQGGRTLDLDVYLTRPEWFELSSRPLIAGRLFTREDEERRTPVCVMGESAARRLFAAQPLLGSSVMLGERAFQVVGIVADEWTGPGGGTPAPEAFVPLSAGNDRFGQLNITFVSNMRVMERVDFHRIIVEADAPEHVEPLAEAMNSMLARFHPKGDYEVQVPLALLRQAEQSKRMFNLVLGSIAGISLLVGGIGIMNIMLASVTERTREIGIRRAIGARRAHIIAQFLVETSTLSGFGGLVGIGVGVLIPRLITRFSGMPTEVPAYALILSFTISVGIGIVFGLYPAFRAAKLDPITALRHE